MIEPRLRRLILGLWSLTQRISNIQQKRKHLKAVRRTTFIQIYVIYKRIPCYNLLKGIPLSWMGTLSNSFYLLHGEQDRKYSFLQCCLTLWDGMQIKRLFKFCPKYIGYFLRNIHLNRITGSNQDLYRIGATSIALMYGVIWQVALFLKIDFYQWT